MPTTLARSVAPVGGQLLFQFCRVRRGHDAQWCAAREGDDVLDRLAVEDAHLLLGDVAGMRRQHDVVQTTQRMIAGQGFACVDIETGAADTTRRERVDQRGFVDDRPA